MWPGNGAVKTCLQWALCPYSTATVIGWLLLGLCWCQKTSQLRNLAPKWCHSGNHKESDRCVSWAYCLYLKDSRWAWGAKLFAWWKGDPWRISSWFSILPWLTCAFPAPNRGDLCLDEGPSFCTQPFIDIFCKPQYFCVLLQCLHFWLLSYLFPLHYHMHHVSALLRGLVESGQGVGLKLCPVHWRVVSSLQVVYYNFLFLLEWLLLGRGWFIGAWRPTGGVSFGGLPSYLIGLPL